MRGYKLIEKLLAEANEVAMEERAELMREAAREIESLIQEYKQLNNNYEIALRALEAIKR